MAGALALATPPAAVAVTEQVRLQADGTTTLSHEVVVDAGPPAVWAAISTLDGWKTWAVPVGWVPGQPNVFETSYDPRARPGDPMNIKNEFVSSLAGRQLVFRTIKAPDGFPHFETLKQVNQTFDLTPEGRRTRVRLTGSGYADNASGKALLAFFKGGNKASLEMLRERFASGPIVWAEKLKKPRT